MTMPEPFAARLKALRKSMSKSKLSALLVMRPENRRYLSGFTAHDGQLDESSGCLFITQRKQFLLTDFRYKIEAERDAKGFDVVIYGGGAASAIGKLGRKYSVKTLGFEEEIVSVKFHRLLKGEIGKVKLTAATGLAEELRVTKDAGEVRKMSKALRVAEYALGKTIEYMKPGHTEIELARYLESIMMEQGAEGTAFDSIVAGGPNAALPHAVPGKRKVREGEPVIFDIGAVVEGYRSDITRTAIMGDPKPWLKKIYTIVHQAQKAAIKAMGPGMRTDEADAVARDIISEAGFGPDFGHGLGHGVGLATHEAPSLSWRMSAPLKPGMVVTVEPGIYLEGKGGVRLEQMVLITETGCRVLNKDKHFYQWPAS